MRKRFFISRDHGFSLVELLIVMLLVGLVVGAMFSVFLRAQRNAYTQDELVDVQQNLRVAMDWIGRDIRNAGFLVQGPIASAPANLNPGGADSLVLQTASTSGSIARITPNPLGPPASYAVNAGATVQFAAALADMVDLFVPGNPVRIVRPENLLEPLSGAFNVQGVNRTARTITLTDFGGNATFQAGDVIVRSAVYPSTITYTLDSQLRLIRNDGVTSAPVAEKISGFGLAYIMDNGTENTGPVTGTDLERIKAVRVRMTGITDVNETGSQQFGTGGVKTRQMMSVFPLKNRR